MLYVNDLVKEKATNTEATIIFSFKEKGVRYYNIKSQDCVKRCTEEELELVYREKTFDYLNKVNDLVAYDKLTIIKLYIAWELQAICDCTDAQINLLVRFYMESDCDGISQFIAEVENYLLWDETNDIQEYIDYEMEKE